MSRFLHLSCMVAPWTTRSWHCAMHLVKPKTLLLLSLYCQLTCHRSEKYQLPLYGVLVAYNSMYVCIVWAYNSMYVMTTFYRAGTSGELCQGWGMVLQVHVSTRSPESVDVGMRASHKCKSARYYHWSNKNARGNFNLVSFSMCIIYLLFQGRGISCWCCCVFEANWPAFSYHLPLASQTCWLLPRRQLWDSAQPREGNDWVATWLSWYCSVFICTIIYPIMLYMFQKSISSTSLARPRQAKRSTMSTNTTRSFRVF